MTDSVPRNSPAMYWRVRPSVPPGTSGLGPSRLARELVPLPLATNSVLPARSIRTAVGYQPAGMNPRGVLPPRSFTLMTAMSLVLALATNSADSSGDRQSELGVH